MSCGCHQFFLEENTAGVSSVVTSTNLQFGRLMTFFAYGNFAGGAELRPYISSKDTPTVDADWVPLKDTQDRVIVITEPSMVRMQATGKHLRVELLNTVSGITSVTLELV